MTTNLYELHAREKAGMPDTWLAYRYAHMPPNGPPNLYTSISGAVVTVLYKSGKRKGHPNWSKKDPATEREVIITPAEHDAWVAGWESRTGKCSRCMGNGDTPKSCRIVDGVAIKERATCRVCGGSGKAKGVTA